MLLEFFLSGGSGNNVVEPGMQRKNRCHCQITAHPAKGRIFGVWKCVCLGGGGGDQDLQGRGSVWKM